MFRGAQHRTQPVRYNATTGMHRGVDETQQAVNYDSHQSETHRDLTILIFRLAMFAVRFLHIPGLISGWSFVLVGNGITTALRYVFSLKDNGYPACCGVTDGK